MEKNSKLCSMFMIWDIQNVYKFFVFILVFLCFSFTLTATTYTTIESGNWTSSSVWQGGIVPPVTIDNNDNIIISNNHNITLNNTLTFNNNCELIVNGYLLINGDIVANNALTFTITGKMVINGTYTSNNNFTTTITGDLLVTQDFDIKNNAALSIDGSLNVYGNFTGTNNNVLTGEGEVNVKGTLTGLNTSGFSGVVNQQFSANIGLSNNGCIIKVGTNSVIYVDGGTQGNFNSLFNGGTDGRIDSDGEINIEGDWNNYSSDVVFINQNSNGSVKYSGSTSQKIGGSKATQFEELVVNNASGLLINDNVLIENSLVFNSGNITTGLTDTVIVLNNASDAIINMGQSRNVAGNLRRYITTGTYTFPMASGSDYLPATITINNSGSMNYVSAKFTESATQVVPSGLIVAGTYISEFLNKGFWTFTPDNGTGVNYDITLTSAGHTNGGFEPTQHAIFKRDVGNWLNVGDHDNSTQSGFGNDPITVKRSNLTGFSDFIIGRSESWPLPIVLSNFVAICTPDGFSITWQTLTEINNDYFLLEYSYNGIDFFPLINEPGAGTSFRTINYSYHHKIETVNLIYYQLTQVDFDGQSIVFPLVAAQCNSIDGKTIKIDEIADDHIMLSFYSFKNASYSVSLTDALGRVIVSNKKAATKGNNKCRLELPNLTLGAYILHFTQSDFRYSKKIILE